MDTALVNTAPAETPPWSARRDGPALLISGTLDQLTAAEVAARLAAEVPGGALWLDLSGVDFCDVAGVRALLAGRDAARALGLVLQVEYFPHTFTHLRPPVRIPGKLSFR